MTDTSHIDPHWPVDAEEQPSLPLDLGESSRLTRTGGVLTIDLGIGETIPAAVLDHRTEDAPAPPPTLTLSKSEIGVLRRCPRRYKYEYVLGRTPAAGPGIEAQWGTALHRGLEGWYSWVRSRAEGKIVGAITDDRGVEFAIGYMMTPGVDSEGRDYAPLADPYARAALRAMLRAYAAAWGPGDAERYEVVAVELPFDLPVLTAEGRVSRGRREGARREGRIDAIVRERAARGPDPVDAGEVFDAGPDLPGRVWIVEHKSTGKPPAEDRFYLGIDLDLQSALYFDAARELGYQPAGVLYDVIRRPDFDDPKPAPARNKDGSERKAPSTGCDACYGKGTWICEWCKGEGKSVLTGEVCSSCNGKICFCEACKGTGRVSKQVAYTNPRHGEPAAVYEERVYQLAIERPGDYFHRRALTIETWQIEEAREDVRAAALEIAWRTREELWPRVGDRYVCAAPRMTCPWIDVCGRRESAEDDRLFPLKRKKEGTT